MTGWSSGLSSPSDRSVRSVLGGTADICPGVITADEVVVVSAGRASRGSECAGVITATAGKAVVASAGGASRGSEGDASDSMVDKEHN